LAPELPKEPGGGVGGVAEDAEEIPGRPLFNVGPGVRVLAATAPDSLPRLAMESGEAIQVAFNGWWESTATEPGMRVGNSERLVEPCVALSACDGSGDARRRRSKDSLA
jgi:hypothetical protein